MIPLTTLKDFQRDIVLRASEIIGEAADAILLAPGHRRRIAADLGLVALQAPTGSGKTLMSTAVMDAVSHGPGRKIVWFWFAPFAGLIDQTRLSINSSGASLRTRMLANDRVRETTRTGDVFLTTWAAVAASAQDTRQIRTASEEMPSADALVAALRAEGFVIGCVVDEAHHSFSINAQAGRFWADVLRPDITLAVTATPDHERLHRIRNTAGLSRVRMFSVSRDDVVRARLNKGRLRLVTFIVPRPEEPFIDMNEAAVHAGVLHHRSVKANLAALGIGTKPLLLVQVDGDDGVAQARTVLQRHGIPEDAIAVHTANEPDPDLVAMARGNDKEVLIFKVAVALGFDAPRAFTLVSTRSVRDHDFGTQVVGRLMRVLKPLQRIPVEDSAAAAFLDEAVVFIANRSNGGGIMAAGERLRALRSEVDTLSSNLTISEVSGTREIRFLDRNGQAILLPPEPEQEEDLTTASPPVQPAGQDTPRQRPVQGTLFGNPAPRPATLRTGGDRLFADPATDEPAQIGALGARAAARGGAHAAGINRYPLRDDIAFPRRLLREEMPEQVTLIDEIVTRLRITERILLGFQKRTVDIGERKVEIFSFDTTNDILRTPVTRRKVHQQAVQLLMFNDGVDAGALYRAIERRIVGELNHLGIPVPPRDELRLGCEIVLAQNPDMLKAAQREAMAEKAVLVEAAALPEQIISPLPLEPAVLNLYRVFPSNMNSWEREFAERLDTDFTSTVRWWHRNPDRKPESVSIVLESGYRFYPDFVVGVENRNTPGGVALAETKGDYASLDAVMKARTAHGAYGKAIMLFLDSTSGDFIHVVSVTPTMNQPGAPFRFDMLRAA